MITKVTDFILERIDVRLVSYTQLPPCEAYISWARVHRNPRIIQFLDRVDSTLNNADTSLLIYFRNSILKSFSKGLASRSCRPANRLLRLAN